MADLVTTISETVTLNGSLRGSTNSVTTTDIVDVVERIVTCTHSQTTTIAVFDAFPYSSAGAFDVDRLISFLLHLLCLLLLLYYLNL